MTVDPVPLTALEVAHSRLFTEVHTAFTENDREFLISVAAGQPDWTRFSFPDIAGLPAVRWTLQNVARMTAVKRRAAVEELRQAFWPQGSAPEYTAVDF